MVCSGCCLKVQVRVLEMQRGSGIWTLSDAFRFAYVSFAEYRHAIEGIKGLSDSEHREATV